MRNWESVDNLLHDIFYAARSLRRSPAFAVSAIVTLALGIGANTAIFTVIRTVLLKPLEYRQPDRLVRLVLTVPHRNVADQALSGVRFDEMKAAAHSFSELGAYGPAENFTLSRNGETEVVNGARVSANFLDILGLAPLVGRGFLPQEDASGGPRVAIISSELWRRRFQSDPHIAGKTATLDATSYTIVGVLPSGFAYPAANVEVWVPRPTEWSALPSRWWRFVGLLRGFARLKPGVTLEQANAELNVLQRRYAAAHPNPIDSDPRVTLRAVPLRDELVANVRAMLWMLFGAVGLVLLIACSNVASLLVARATSRAREFAVRAAIGAGRGRLIRQLLAESLVVASAGGALGILLAVWTLRLIPHLDAIDLPRAGEIRLDAVVLGFTLVLSIATGVLFGLFPSFAASRPDLVTVLRESGAAAGQGSGGMTKGRGLLVIAQVALATVLLIGASLLLKSFARLERVDPGFQTAHLITMRLVLPLVHYGTDSSRSAFFGELVRRVENTAGVRNAAVALSLPTTKVLQTNVFNIEGRPGIGDPDYGFPDVQLQSVTPAYFQTLGIPLRRGREFTARDNAWGAPPVAMINESLARLLWPDYPRGDDPVGRHISEGADKAVGPIEIVGIVRNVHERGLATEAKPEFYIPSVIHPPQRAYLVVRANGDPSRLVNAIRKELREIDADQAISDVRSMDDVLEASLGQRRVTMLLVGTFAGLALLLATIGIYGLLSYVVAQRTQEVGIRRALGAQHGDILRLVLGRALALSLAGVAGGVFGAFALSRVMREFVFQISATDPVIFLAIPMLFILVGLAASLIPAMRATRVDPMTALRVG